MTDSPAARLRAGRAGRRRFRALVAQGEGAPPHGRATGHRAPRGAPHGSVTLSLCTPLFVHSTPDPLTHSVSLLLGQQYDRTLGAPRLDGLPAAPLPARCRAAARRLWDAALLAAGGAVI
jgi:hypothetical protein